MFLENVFVEDVFVEDVFVEDVFKSLTKELTILVFPLLVSSLINNKTNLNSSCLVIFKGYGFLYSFLKFLILLISISKSIKSSNSRRSLITLIASSE